MSLDIITLGLAKSYTDEHSGGGGQVQPDWNQNDDTKPDYVKNRTHWTEPEILDVIFQQDDVALYDATDFLQAEQLLIFSEELVVGDTYNVNIDGVDHYVVCYTSNSDVSLGKEWPDRFTLFGSGSSATLYLYQFDYGSTVRLTITHITPSKIHKLDPKYLPDQTQPDWNQNDETAEDHIKNRTHYEEVIDEYVIFEGTLPKFDTTTGLSLQYAIPSNTRVTAYYNGRIVATVVGSAMAGETNRVSHLFTPDLTLIVDNSTMKASVYNGFGDGVLKFVAENFTAVHTLDEKYLPSSVKSVGSLKMDANNPVGTGSFSMGRKPDSVIGVSSHAEGSNTTASGDYSHAEGISTIAGSMYQHVQGRNNIEDSSNKYAHIVGNGVSSVSRSNAHTLDWSGIPWYQGRPQFGGTAMDNGAQTVMANGDKEIILASSTANSTKKFKITVDDSGALTATEVTA